MSNNESSIFQDNAAACPNILEVKKAAIMGIRWLESQPSKLSHGDLVFVYGTLKRGEGNNEILGDSPFLGKAKTSAPWAFPIWDRGIIPFVLPIEDGKQVIGEVYQPNAKTWSALDRLERHPKLYHRALIEVEIFGKGFANAWMYFFKHPMVGDLDPKRWGSEWRPDNTKNNVHIEAFGG